MEANEGKGRTFVHLLGFMVKWLNYNQLFIVDAAHTQWCTLLELSIIIRPQSLSVELQSLHLVK